jgi:GWxTD domain-containing protein
MTMKIQRTLSALVLAAISASALAAVSPGKADWARGPVQYIMTKEEAAAWKALPDDAAADAFVALFWARRDPTPATPQNEFREDFEARVKFVDDKFTTTANRGWTTDRGKTFIIFGQPKHAQNVVVEPEPASNRVVPNSAINRETEAQAKRQRWTYEGPETVKMFNTAKMEILFIDKFGTGDFRLEPGRTEYTNGQARVIAMNITQPDLTKVPVYEAPKSAQAPPPPAAPEGIHTPTLQAAADAVREGKQPSSAAAHFSFAEFVSPLGDYFVPMALTIPASANVVGTSVDTFFGDIRDAAGAKVASFEEPAKPIASKTGWFVDKTLVLPSGKYTAVLGVAKAGQPVLTVSAPFETKTVAKDFVGTSKLMLWNDVVVLKDPLPVKSPYAFGTLQLVPNPEGTFTNQDELGYFIEINNPGIDPASNGPKLQMSIDLMAKGDTVSRQPLTEAPAVALSGQPGAGQYAIVNSIPLNKLSKPLAPGSYSLKIKILDTVTKQSYTLQEPFKITG